MALILAIDQGTTGTKVQLCTPELEIVAEASIDFAQHFPEPGWVEHDLEEIWQSVTKAIAEAVSKIGYESARDIVAIGITNQRETVGFWRRSNGAALGRAIVWQDRRTAAACEALRAEGHEAEIRAQTGLVLDPYFSATKIAWALQNRPEIAEALAKGDVLCGTIDSFLVHRLTGEHVTEPSNASRTMLFDLHTASWSEKLQGLFKIPSTILPRIQPSFSRFGVTKAHGPLPAGIPVTGILGDQQSALLGQACTKPGMMKCTYGTGAFVLANTGSTPKMSQSGLLTTVAWQTADGRLEYALEGSAFIAGAAVQWARDGIGIIKKSAEIEGLARAVEHSDGVVFVPALAGLGAPHWDPHAKGAFFGITRGTQRSHLARAVLDGMALQCAELFSALEKDFGQKLTHLNVDGGVALNAFFLQLQADCTGLTLRRPTHIQTTALGAVFAAGLGAGIYSDFAAIQNVWKLGAEVPPQLVAAERERLRARWSKAVAAVRMFGAGD